MVAFVKKAPVFEIYTWGLCFASVCTSLSPEEATRRINIELPTGISSKWEIHDEPFKCGTPNPCDCPDYDGNKHYLFSC